MAGSDGPTRREIARVKRLWNRFIGKWEDVLRIYDHTFYYYFEEGDPPEGVNGYPVSVRVFTNSRYLQARFHVYVQILRHLDDQDFEEIVVHELLHVKNGLYEEWKRDVLKRLADEQAASALEDYFKNVNEYVTERLTQAFIRLEKKTRKGARGK